jgi:N-acetylglucosaminyl-diphospho-decaprenol L-rhamnosyltransferase
LNSHVKKITVSIVSHSHGQMVVNLVDQLLNFPQVAKVIVTCNVPENLDLPNDERLQRINNLWPKGFAANHNTAFDYCCSTYYCVVNPDISLHSNPFPLLIECLVDNVALSAPLVFNPLGMIEDSARKFPTFLGLFFKLIGISDGRYSYDISTPSIFPDWVAGMFMLFRALDYDAVGRFDDKYFLYYEDVDICVRLRNSGRSILLCPQAIVVHAAQRSSHRNIVHFIWHLRSMLRYFLLHWRIL